MEMEMIEERENKFLDRVEIVYLVRHEAGATPSRRDIMKELTGRFGYDPSKTVVYRVETLTGSNTSYVYVYYYPNGIDYSTLEPSKRWKVVKLGEEESKAEEEEA